MSSTMHAQMMEQYEKQYAASTVTHSDQSSKNGDRTHNTVTSTVKDESVEQE